MSKCHRYAVECDTPDQGQSTYPECFGSVAVRGRVLFESDSLAECIQFCDGNPGTSTSGVVPWIWDRLNGDVVREFATA